MKTPLRKYNNPAINPRAAEICGNGIDDNCNGQIEGVVSGLTTTNISSNKATLNWVAPVSLIFWQVDYKKSNSSKWSSVILFGYFRSLNLNSISPNQTYNWRIRGLCGIEARA